ncbi:hypothetical protein AJ79_07852 [Helicocarpus griseus UAMH5409]|uniref:CBF1-interacting co-repressor CIR N-terminal domain-containing protein n=1 Tax=Helicocarpus griseus UAMH5409 TaxID=1447875 RepID=A0A2B7WZ56_9EURO|nr:hypothetical protein AJ79_07852 [Helicocarpus griseus UAMH5409]
MVFCYCIDEKEYKQAYAEFERMVLHLLGKKSWNVYNADNIARVRRDEAEAQAREEQERRDQQQTDAEKRIQILRGLRSSSRSPSPPSKHEEKPKAPERRDGERGREANRPCKRRRIAGENDTDRDIRFAREDAERADAKREEDVVLFRRPSKKGSGDDEAPLVDEAGHISLFPEPKANAKRGDSGKNPEAEAEAARKKREYEDQYTMRFSNAAGFKQSVGNKPWYSSSTVDLAAQMAGDEQMPSKDVWGNEDPRRRERERERINSSDPLAAIKKGVSRLRDVERERKKWEEERRAEMRALKEEMEAKERREERRSHHRRRRRRRERRGSDTSRDSLEGFSLDAAPAGEGRREREHESSRKHHRSHRERRERSRERTSRHSRSHDDRHSHQSSKHRERDRSRCSSRDERSYGRERAPGKRYSVQFAGV